MKILTVCGMGLGSSLLLRIGVEDVLRQLHVEAQVEAVDITTAKAGGADLIVTSAQFAEMLEGVGVPLVPIHDYVDRNEMREKLRAALHIGA